MMLQYSFLHISSSNRPALIDILQILCHRSGLFEHFYCELTPMQTCWTVSPVMLTFSAVSLTVYNDSSALFCMLNVSHLNIIKAIINAIIKEKSIYPCYTTVWQRIKIKLMEITSDIFITRKFIFLSLNDRHVSIHPATLCI